MTTKPIEQVRKEVAEFYAMMEERKAPKGRFQHFKDDAYLQRHLKYVKEAVDSGEAKF